ncbi:hypothetical protein KY495_00145 [Massilia sp. PAMC28688]|uniref:hypothetical protein n=1 Tax=Massilia sp. PAMC28688 TaxID=2861283 RepID=UPI001C638263|nr:hypothetical protein [Massilia sp. PAMC28688]QYF93691.1 hypothetical protein KY495_00145 [Massilia sp. PAMC28688]
MQARHQLYATVLTGAALWCASGTVQATPAFSGHVTLSVDQNTGYAKVCFKETKLPKKPVTYTITGRVTASYACRNRGGNCPPGQDTTIKDNVNASATYTPDKHGTVSACMVIKVPAPHKSPCPDEMALVLQAVNWSGMAISDVTHAIGPVACTPSKTTVNYGSCPKR